MQRKIRVMAGLTGLLLTVTQASFAYTGEQYASKAAISIEQARTIALKAHPGKITDEELEYEKGGSGLRYSFDVVVHGDKQEVGVDARTGKVLENQPETEDMD